jgi:hypothetical protein
MFNDVDRTNYKAINVKNTLIVEATFHLCSPANQTNICLTSSTQYAAPMGNISSLKS